MIGATMVAMATMDIALPRCDGSNVSRMMDCWLGCNPPPKKPCARRKIINSGRLVEKPQSRLHTVNMPMQIRK
jgi:hypothetical protein